MTTSMEGKIEWQTFHKKGGWKRSAGAGWVTIGKAHMTISNEDRQKFGTGDFVKVLVPKNQGGELRYFGVTGSSPADADSYRLGHGNKEGRPATVGIAKLIEQHHIQKGKYPARWQEDDNILVVDLSQRVQ